MKNGKVPKPDHAQVKLLVSQYDNFTGKYRKKKSGRKGKSKKSRRRKLSEDDDFQHEYGVGYEFTNIDKDGLDIKLTFSDPTTVTLDEKYPDKLFFEIENKDLFISEKTNLPLTDVRFNTTMPRQWANEAEK